VRNDSNIPDNLKPVVNRLWGHWLGESNTEELTNTLLEVVKQMNETQKEIDSLSTNRPGAEYSVEDDGTMRFRITINGKTYKMLIDGVTWNSLETSPEEFISWLSEKDNAEYIQRRGDIVLGIGFPLYLEEDN